MGRKLIGAYEEEQTRIVRELYDNINQQIASFGCEVDRRNAR
jgi:signal transduction histidine kinase